MQKVYDIRNDYKIRMVAGMIAASNGTGTAASDKIETVLRDFKEVTGIKDLHYLSQENVSDYYQFLQESGKSNSTLSNKISYFNEVLSYYGKGEYVKTAKELDVSRRTDIWSNKCNDQKDMKIVQDYLKSVNKVEFQGLYHSQKLQETCGLRMAESGGIKLLEKSVKDIENGILRIDGRADLAKNDRDRTIHLDKAGIEAVLEARAFLKENKLKDITESKPGKVVAWTAWSWRQVENLKKIGIIDGKFHNHGNRHFWANNKYESLWEVKTGVRIEATAKSGLFGREWLSYVEMKTGLTADGIKAIDTEIRQKISNELGHERISITACYLGKKA